MPGVAGATHYLKLFKAAIDDYYGNRSACAKETIARLSNDESNAPAFGMNNEDVERIYSELQNSDELLHKDVYKHTRNVLHRAVDKVYGQPKFTDPEYQKAFELKQNLSRFAGFKSAWQSKELAEAGTTDEAHAINNTYNSNWLRTEYVHAVRSSRGAKRWGQMQADKDLYPFLQYMPSTSAEPRSDHKRMYGVIKHLDDAFWDRWFPPNDWGCKCGTAPMRGDDDSRPVPDDIKPPVKAMRNNPGKTGKIITDDHAMIKTVSAKGKERIEKQQLAHERNISRNKVASLSNALANTVYPTRDQKVINIPKGAVGKIISQGSDMDILRNELVSYLPGIIRDMKPTKVVKPSNSRRRNIINSHIYELQWGEYQISLLVWEMVEKGKIKYNLHAMHLKK